MSDTFSSVKWYLLFYRTERNGTPGSFKYLFYGTLPKQIKATTLLRISIPASDEDAFQAS